MEVSLVNMEGKEKGKVMLPGIFEVKPKGSLLHEIVVAFLANQRAGTHSTKTRGEVSGGGIKPWKQKGTGRARAGSTRSPLWRKGGITFGPKPRSYYQSLPQKKKQIALYMALSKQASDNNVLVVDNLSVKAPKTKEAATILKGLGLTGKKVLILTAGKVDASLRRALKNIEGVVIEEFRNINAYQILWANKLVINSELVSKLQEIKVSEKKDK